MSFYKKLHSSETGLEIMEKYHTWTFMAAALPVGAVVFLHSEWDCQKFSPCLLFQPLLLQFKKVLCIFWSQLALGASFTALPVAQRPLGSIKIPTHFSSFVILQPRRKRKKRMMTWKSWKLGQEPCNHSSPWLEKRLWLPILGANVFCWGESISKMSLSLILTQSSGNCIAVFCIAWKKVCPEERRGSRGIACCRYGWISVEKVFAKSNSQLWDCAPATAGSSSSIWAIYWIEISWKTLCNFKSV